MSYISDIQNVTQKSQLSFNELTDTIVSSMVKKVQMDPLRWKVQQ